MGRGGPAEPVVVESPPSVEDLLALSRAGAHAASDYLEGAALAGVTTVGCRRCGGGLAGTPGLERRGGRPARSVPEAGYRRLRRERCGDPAHRDGQPHPGGGGASGSAGRRWPARRLPAPAFRSRRPDDVRGAAGHAGRGRSPPERHRRGRAGSARRRHGVAAPSGDRRRGPSRRLLHDRVRAHGRESPGSPRTRARGGGDARRSEPRPPQRVAARPPDACRDDSRRLPRRAEGRGGRRRLRGRSGPWNRRSCSSATRSFRFPGSRNSTRLSSRSSPRGRPHERRSPSARSLRSQAEGRPMSDRRPPGLLLDAPLPEIQREGPRRARAAARRCSSAVRRARGSPPSPWRWRIGSASPGSPRPIRSARRCARSSRGSSCRRSTTPASRPARP